MFTLIPMFGVHRVDKSIKSFKNPLNKSLKHDAYLSTQGQGVAESSNVQVILSALVTLDSIRS